MGLYTIICCTFICSTYLKLENVFEKANGNQWNTIKWNKVEFMLTVLL